MQVLVEGSLGKSFDERQTYLNPLALLVAVSG